MIKNYLESYDGDRYSYCSLCINSGSMSCQHCSHAFTSMFEAKSFTDDEEKMKDFYELSKEEFLRSYSYMTEEEYDATAREVAYDINN